MFILFQYIHFLLLLRSLLYFENLVYRVFIIDFIPIFCLSRFGFGLDSTVYDVLIPTVLPNRNERMVHAHTSFRR